MAGTASLRHPFEVLIVNPGNFFGAVEKLKNIILLRVLHGNVSNTKGRCYNCMAQAGELFVTPGATSASSHSQPKSLTRA